MDIIQLRYFLAAARHLNYTKAADELFITRQSLRQAIGAMEDEIGNPLFKNVRNKLSLTEHGEFLAIYAEELVNSFDNMLMQLGSISRGELSLKAAISKSLVPFLLPDINSIISAFKARFPDIRLEVVLLDNDSLIRAVEDGEIDCGCLIQMPCERPNLEVYNCITLQTALDMCESFPLAEKKSLTLKDLDGLSLIGAGCMYETFRPLEAACRAQNVNISYRIIPDVIDAFYEVNHGTAALIDMLMRPGDFPDNILNIPLEGFNTEIGFLYRITNTKTQLVHLLVSFINKEYRQRFEI